MLMRSTICLLRTLSLVLLTVSTTGCCKSGGPSAPRIVTVRESCLRQPAPAKTTLIDCLTLGNEPKDCLAREIRIRDKWIAAAIARCEVTPP